MAESILDNAFAADAESAIEVPAIPSEAELISIVGIDTVSPAFAPA